MPGSLNDLWEEMKDKNAGFNPRTLIIYRPQNIGEMNDIRCFLKVEDEQGQDVTYSACSATYEWVTDNMKPFEGSSNFSSLFKKDNRNVLKYKRKYFLSGAMAMHLVLKKGRYKISFYTPVENQNMFTYPEKGTEPFEWQSNVFYYTTENPTAVIFVTPTANDNGFYNGGWYIDHKAPSYIKKSSVPKMQ